MNVEKMVRDLFQAVDSKYTEKFLTFLTDDAIFRFGNNPPVEGKEAIKGAVNGFFESIAELIHTISKVWNANDTVICKGEATYTRKDNKKVTVPFVNLFGVDGQKIKEYLIYVDVSPLFAE